MAKVFVVSALVTFSCISSQDEPITHIILSVDCGMIAEAYTGCSDRLAFAVLSNLIYLGVPSNSPRLLEI